MNRLLPLQRELFSVTLSLSLYGFASSLIGVFIPLIILNTGAPLSLVAGFYATYALVKLVLNYPAALIIQRFGPHIGLGGGVVAGVLQLLAILLYANTRSLAALTLGAVALAITNAFLWNSQHIHISRIMDGATKSSSMATMEIIRQITTVAAPLIGGLIAATVGPSWVIAAAVIIAAAALIPLRDVAALYHQGSQVAGAREEEGEMKQAGRAEETTSEVGDVAQPRGPHYDTSPVQRREEVVFAANHTTATRLAYDFRGAPPRDIFANFCFNLDTAIGSFVWPMYLAVAIAGYRGIGVIAGLSAATAIATVWIAGRRGDRGHDRAVLRQGITASSVIHLLRLAAATPLFITLLSAGYRAALAYFQNAWTSTYYHHAKKHGIAYVMSMEIACDLAYAALWSLILVLALTTSHTVLFNVCFIIAATASWGCLLISKQGAFESDSPSA